MISFHQVYNIAQYCMLPLLSIPHTVGNLLVGLGFEPLQKYYIYLFNFSGLPDTSTNKMTNVHVKSENI